MKYRDYSICSLLVVLLRNFISTEGVVLKWPSSPKKAIVFCSFILFLPQVFATECLIEPEKQLDLRFPVVGLIDSVLVKRGDRVSKGQILANLESTAERANAELAKFRSEQVGPSMVAESKVNAAKIKYERRKAMAAENLMSLQDRDDAKGELDQAQAELVSAKESRQAAAIEFRQQQGLLALRTIRSPVDGVVTDQLAFSGEVIEPNDAKRPVLRVAQLSPLRAHLVVPLQDLGKYRLGQQLTLKGESGQKMQASVSMVDKTINAASGFYSVYAAVPNVQGGIMAGVKCVVER
jgi:RND family efflux transporter MFP subunit